MPTEVPRSSETNTPKDPTVDLCLRPLGDPAGVGVSCERGTPVCTSTEAVLDHGLGRPVLNGDESAPF